MSKKKSDKPARTLVLRAICHQCLGRYLDGKMDCQVVACPAYSYMPYAKLQPDLEWMKYNPSRQGQVLWEDSKRTMTEEQREALRERFQKARNSDTPMSEEDIEALDELGGEEDDDE